MKKGPFKQKGFSGFGNEKYKNMKPKKKDQITKKDIQGFIKDMKPKKKDQITQKDIDKFIKEMKKGEHIENLLPKRPNATFTKRKRK